MSEKLGMGVGVPFVESVQAAAALADGYYFQADISDPRTLAGWQGPFSVPLHDGAAGNAGNPATYKGTAQEPTRAKVAWLVKNAAAPMTFDSIVTNVGYWGNWSDGLAFGSNDGVVWTALAYIASVGAPHGGVFSFTNVTRTINVAPPTGPWVYIAGIEVDTSATSQAAVAEITVKNGAVDVGPA